METTRPRFGIIPRGANGKGLSASEWSVLHAIAVHADAAGQAFPSLTTIAKITGIDRKHVPRAVRRLEELGLLRVSRIAKASNLYAIVVWPSKGQ